jgi:ribosomal-protein-alanine N-acetyltransferase
MKFKSERLHLVKFSENLLDERIMSWFQDANLMKYYTNSKTEISKDILLEYINRGIVNKDNFTYFIVHTDTDNIIGTIKVGPINKIHNSSDLVTLIGDSRRYGKGIGTEAIALGIKLAFEKYDIRKLFGGMYASNIASIKAYTRAGWIVEGILTGHYLNNGNNEDRILVGCFNPNYFTKEEILKAKFDKWYDEQE